MTYRAKVLLCLLLTVPFALVCGCSSSWDTTDYVYANIIGQSEPYYLSPGQEVSVEAHVMDSDGHAVSGYDSFSSFEWASTNTSVVFIKSDAGTIKANNSAQSGAQAVITATLPGEGISDAFVVTID